MCIFRVSARAYVWFCLWQVTIIQSTPLREFGVVTDAGNSLRAQLRLPSCSNFAASDDHHLFFGHWSSPLCCPSWTMAVLHRLASWSTILQSALVAAARSVDGFQRLDRITITVASFYQLREASKGISLKLAVIAVHGTAPWCLTNLLHTYHPIKKAFPAVDLRRPSGPYVAEIDHGLLVTTGPSLWNTRPDGITFAPSLLVFRRKLKTHLFGHQYPDIIL